VHRRHLHERRDLVGPDRPLLDRDPELELAPRVGLDVRPLAEGRDPARGDEAVGGLGVGVVGEVDGAVGAQPLDVDAPDLNVGSPALRDRQRPGQAGHRFEGREPAGRRRCRDAVAPGERGVGEALERQRRVRGAPRLHDSAASGVGDALGDLAADASGAPGDEGADQGDADHHRECAAEHLPRRPHAAPDVDAQRGPRDLDPARHRQRALQRAAAVGARGPDLVVRELDRPAAIRALEALHGRRILAAGAASGHSPSAA